MRTRFRRGHTLVEVMFAIGLSSLVMVVAAGWTLSLIGSARQASDVAGFYTETSIVREQLAVDVGAARACDATTPAILEADGNTLQMFISEGGRTQVVTWTVDGQGVLTRSQQNADDCAAEVIPAEGVKLAVGMSAVDGAAFGAYWQGQSVSVAAGDAPSERIVDAIWVRLASDSEQLGVAVPVELTEPVNNYGLAITR